MVVSRRIRSRSGRDEIGAAERGELHAGAALLHLHGGAIDIPCAGGEEQIADVTEQLRAGVIDHGLDDGDGFGFSGGRCHGSVLVSVSPIRMRSRLGSPGVSRPPAP